MIRDAIDFIRSGNGPMLLELETYRWREHCGPFFDNDLGYRTQDEYLSWKERDPLIQFGKHLESQDWADTDELHTHLTQVQQRVDRAFDFAENSPWPEQAEAFTNLYRTPIRG